MRRMEKVALALLAGARRLRRRGPGRGAVAVEYAFVLPVLLLFILGLIEVSRLFWTYTTLYRAAEAAARCGAVNTTLCATSAQIQSYAVTQAYGLSVAASSFTVATAACGITVGASVPFTLLIPWISVGTASGSFNILTLSTTACYPL
jgi:Flp pilus assembly protein TadG